MSVNTHTTKNYSLDTSLIKNKLKYSLRKYSHLGLIIFKQNRIIIKDLSDYKRFQTLIDIIDILYDENIKYYVDENFDIVIKPIEE